MAKVLKQSHCERIVILVSGAGQLGIHKQKTGKKQNKQKNETKIQHTKINLKRIMGTK